MCPEQEITDGMRHTSFPGRGEEVNDSWDRTGQLFIGAGWKEVIKACFQKWDDVGYRPTVERGTNNIPLATLKKYQEIFK